MMNTADVLKKICESPYETASDSSAHRLITALMEPYCERIETDALGNIICTVKSEGEKTVALSAHMDKIGLTVTSVDKKTGMLSLAKTGGVDMRTLSACRVTVQGKKLLPGCITSTPPHLTTGDRKKVTPMDCLFCDTGLPFEEVSQYVSVGDTVLYHSEVTPLINGRFTGAYMDNSAGITAVIRAVKRLKEEGTKNRIIAVFTTREEIGKGGAAAVFHNIAPELALITDVSFASAPGIPSEMSSPLSSGAMICISPVLQKDISYKLRDTAEKYNIPYTLEIMASRTMTDSDVAVTAGDGILTGLVSIPLLNMHTPVETLDIKDVEAVSDILFYASKEEI
ncbi:MAG: M20/M25/M40 family metallo-hydrolase [Clostridia bacterium]|nr:M20/M25/M40 family metallo-hydrolase [Clostridia bacterium]